MNNRHWPVTKAALTLAAAAGFLQFLAAEPSASAGEWSISTASDFVGQHACASACHPPAPWRLLPGRSTRFGSDPCCSCPDDYCRKPLPCAPPPPCHGCCDDYCAKPLPGPPPAPCRWYCDDFCRKPAPPCPPTCSPWFLCYPDGSCCERCPPVDSRR